MTYGTLTEGPTLDPLTMFEDVLKEMPPNLVRQREELRALKATAAAPRAATPPIAQKG